MFFLVGWGSTRMEALYDPKKKKINDLRRLESSRAVLSKLAFLLTLECDPSNEHGIEATALLGRVDC